MKTKKEIEEKIAYIKKLRKKHIEEGNRELEGRDICFIYAYEWVLKE